MLSYLGDKEAPGTIRVILPYLLLNCYKNILANFDFTMSNHPSYFKGLNALQVQRLATPEQYQVIHAIKRSIAPKFGFGVFYDCDDLITDIPEFNSTYEYYNKNKESVLKILETVDCIMCSTAKLAGFFSKYNKTKVIQNRLFEPIWKMHKHTSFFETGAKPKIIWSGGTTHFNKDKDDDFDEKIVNYIKETSNRFEWIFFGHKPLSLEKDQITFYPWTANYFEYPNMLRKIDPDIGIALLAVNDFNRCKSNLKAMEYSALNIPGIYTKITPYEFMSCKITTSDQFIESIEKLTTDQAYYERVRDKDYETLKDNLYWTNAYTKKYLDSYFKP